MYIYNIGLLRMWSKKAALRMWATTLVAASLSMAVAFQDSAPGLPQLRERLAASVKENTPLDRAAAINDLTRIIASEDTATAREEARVMLAMFHSHAGNCDAALKDLKELFQQHESRVYIDIPVKTFAADGRTLITQVVSRPAVELLLQTFFNVAQQEHGPLQLAKLREALPYFELALEVNHTSRQTNGKSDIGAMLRRDKKLVSLVVTAPHPHKIEQLIEALFSIDTQAGTVQIRDSAAASMALTYLAEMVHSTGIGSTARVGELQLTPVELVQMALSLPSTSQPAYRRGLQVLKGFYRDLGATEMAAELVVAPLPQAPRSFEKCRNALDALVRQKDPGQALKLIEHADEVLTIELDLLRELGAPSRIQAITNNAPDHPVNLTDEGPARVELSPISAQRQRQQMYAIEALARWTLAESGQGNRAQECEKALKIGVELDGLLRSAVAETLPAGQRPDPERLLILECLTESLADVQNVPKEELERVEKFAQIVTRLSTSGLVSGSIGTPALTLANLQLVNGNSMLSSCPMVRRNLSRALVRHGFLRQAKESLDLLEQIEISLDAESHPTSRILKAEVQRRQGEAPAAAENELKALANWQRRLAVSEPSLDDIHSALQSLTHFVSKEYRTKLLVLLAPFAAIEHPVHQRYSAAVLFGLQDGRIPELDEYLSKLLANHLKGEVPQVESWEHVLAAVARHGGPQSLDQLFKLYGQRCVPQIVLEAKVAPSAPMVPAPMPTNPTTTPAANSVAAVTPLAPAARYELFRQITEVMLYLDPELTAKVTADFLKAAPEFANVRRPNGHRRATAFHVPLAKSSALRGISDDGLYVHLVPHAELLTGAEWAQFVAVQTPLANSVGPISNGMLAVSDENAVVHREIETLIQRALNSFEANSDTEQVQTEILRAAELVLNSWANDASHAHRWWETARPEVVLNACQQLLSMDSTEATSVELEHTFAAVKCLRASVLLAILDLKSARADLLELEQLVNRDAARLKMLQSMGTLQAAYLTSGTKARLNAYLDSGVNVPYLPRALTLKEALAWCEFLDRTAATDHYSEQLATLVNATAIQGTSLHGGLTALQFFDTQLVPPNGNITVLQDFVSRLNSLGVSGLLAQVASNPPTADKSQITEKNHTEKNPGEKNLTEKELTQKKPVDLSLDSRCTALRAQQVGVRVAVRVDEKTKVWVVPEHVLPLTLAQWEARPERVGDAHAAWAIRSRVSNLPQVDAIQKAIAEIDRVRQIHRFPHSVPVTAVEGTLYPSENDLGVAAFLNGDFELAEKLFIVASQHELRGGLNARRIMQGVERADLVKSDLVKSDLAHYSLTGAGDRATPPELGLDDFAYALQAHRNLALCYYLTGKFDEALNLYEKVREVESRTGHSRHHDPLFAPLDLQVLLPRESQPLSDASDLIATAIKGLATNEHLSAATALDSLPLEFSNSRIAQQLRVHTQLKRYADSTQAKQADSAGDLQASMTALLDLEKIAVALGQTKLKGTETFQVNPAWLFLQAELAQEQQARRGEVVAKGVIEPHRLQGGTLLRDGLKEINNLLTAPIPPAGLPEWVTVYLAEAPHLIASNPDLFQGSQTQPAAFPETMGLYNSLIKAACAPGTSIEWTTAILQPLALGDSNAFESILVTLLPTDPPALDALAAPLRFDMSKLDWMLAVLVRAGQGNPSSQVRNLLIERCQAYPLGSDASFAMLDALYALDPARATRAALQRLIAMPVPEMERVLASRNVHVVRRQGVQQRGLIGGPTALWYGDSSAFWFYPQEEINTSTGDRLFAGLVRLLNNPQELAMVMPELEGLTRLERLKPIAHDKLAAPASCRFHGQLAKLLRDADTPAALALLSRYNDCEPLLTIGAEVQITRASGKTLAGTIVKEDATIWTVAHTDASQPALTIDIEKSGQALVRPAPASIVLREAVEIARAQHYGKLATAPWLADIPGSAAWKGQLGPQAWKAIAKYLPGKLEINDPTPDSAFVRELLLAAENDVKRGVSAALIKTTRDSAVTIRVYNELIKEVLKNRQLPQPTNVAPPTEIATFQQALDHAHEYVRQALRADRSYGLNAKGERIDPKDTAAMATHEQAIVAKAQYMVNHEVQQFTTRLWLLASHYAATGESLRDCSLSEVNARYRALVEQKLRDNSTLVQSKLVTAAPAGEANDYLYRDDLQLVGRDLYLAVDPKQARYEETYNYLQADGQTASVTLRGEIPFSYYVALQEEPRLLDLLDISLARRRALLASPLGAMRLSLDVALAAPHVAWPVLMQDAGRQDLNTYLIMSTRELFPTTANEFMRLVAPDALVTVDVAQRKAADELRMKRLAESQFNQAYSAQVLARAPGIRDHYHKKFWGITIATYDNENKKSLLRNVSTRAASAAATQAELKAHDLFRLCDANDPPRYAMVTDTGLDKDGKNWTCRYRIVTVLGNEIFHERTGKVSELPDICQYLISANPGIASKLRLDLGMLTTDPATQIYLALNATAAVESEIIPQLNVGGLTANEMRIATGFPLSQFPGKDQAFLEAKQQKYYELAAKAFPVHTFDPNDSTVNPRLQKLVQEVQEWKQKIHVDATGHANRIVDEIIAASHDIHSFGIFPGVLAIDFQNGKFIGFQAVFTVSTGENSKPNFQLGYHPEAWKFSHPTHYVEKIDGKTVFDSRMGMELPKFQNR